MWCHLSYITPPAERRNSNKQPNCMKMLAHVNYTTYNNGLKSEEKVSTAEMTCNFQCLKYTERERLQQEATQRLSQLPGSASRKVHMTCITWFCSYHIMSYLQPTNSSASRSSGWEAIQKGRSSSHKRPRQLATSAATTQRSSSQAPLITSLPRHVKYK